MFARVQRSVPSLGHALIVALVALFPIAAFSQAAGPATSVRSFSGQFIAGYRAPGLVPLEVSAVATNAGFVRLQPGTLAVSAERIRQAVWRDLGVSGSWKGKVFLAISGVQTTNDPVFIGTEPFQNGWQYGVELPQVVGTERYVRAIVQVVLLELANRGSTDRSAEIPIWLSEGFARRILAAQEAEVILAPPHFVGASLPGANIVNAQRENPLKRARERLAEERSFTFQELSWPKDSQLTGAEGEMYRTSAQVFLNELLLLKGGSACLRDMLALLPRYYNWQIAFLRAFSPHFQRPLDIEKWWALQLAHFVARESADNFPPTESWLRLEEILSAPVQVWGSTNQGPRYTSTTIQTVIRDWTRADQVRLLREKLAQLHGIRLRISPDFVPVVDSYRALLQDYLAPLKKAEDRHARDKGAVSRRGMIKRVTLQLDELDLQRAALRPGPGGTNAVPAMLLPGVASRSP